MLSALTVFGMSSQGISTYRMLVGKTAMIMTSPYPTSSWIPSLLT